MKYRRGANLRIELLSDSKINICEKGWLYKKA